MAEVWQANPQVHNPHLIYPGDVLNLAYLNGRPGISIGGGSRGGVEPHTRAEQLESAIKPLPLSVIEDFLKKPRFLGEEDFKHAPHVVGIEDHHLNGSPGQLIYVHGLEGQPGQHFALARPIGRYYEITSKDGHASQIFRQPLDTRESRPDMLWHHGPHEWTLHGDVRFLGYEMLNFGDVQVTKAGSPASTIAVATDYEIRPAILSCRSTTSRTTPSTSTSAKTSAGRDGRHRVHRCARQCRQDASGRAVEWRRRWCGEWPDLLDLCAAMSSPIADYRN